MHIRRRTLLGSAIGSMALTGTARSADRVIRIGVLSDLSGPYRDTSGPTVLACVRQAVADFGPQDFSIEVLSADHQNKADIGVAIVRKWFDQDGVDAIIDVNNSAIALACGSLVVDQNKVHLNSGAASSDLTGVRCNANTVAWSYDTWEQAHSTCGALAKVGGDSWFFITADYAFGHAMERDAAAFVAAAGGRTVGQARYPFGTTTDFSAFLLQAQASGAKVVGFCNAGADTVNCIKQAAEFGLPQRGVKLAGMFVFVTDVHAMGLETAQGVVLTETFYWDLNDRTRAFAKRVLPRTPNNMPNMEHAGGYSAVLHYLKSVKAMGAAASKESGRATVATMKSIPTDDDAFGPGRIREDGRKLCPAYLFEVKKPSESTGPWDVYKLLYTTPAEEAFRPLSAGNCPMIKV